MEDLTKNNKFLKVFRSQYQVSLCILFPFSKSSHLFRSSQCNWWLYWKPWLMRAISRKEQSPQMSGCIRGSEPCCWKAENLRWFGPRLKERKHPKSQSDLQSATGLKIDGCFSWELIMMAVSQYKLSFSKNISYEIEKSSLVLINVFARIYIGTPWTNRVRIEVEVLLRLCALIKFVGLIGAFVVWPSRGYLSGYPGYQRGKHLIKGYCGVMRSLNDD